MYFFDVFGLYNKDSIVNLNDTAFRLKINEYFHKTIHQFEEHFNYNGLSGIAGTSVFDYFKPGDMLLK